MIATDNTSPTAVGRFAGQDKPEVAAEWSPAAKGVQRGNVIRYLSKPKRRPMSAGFHCDLGRLTSKIDAETASLPGFSSRCYAKTQYV